MNKLHYGNPNDKKLHLNSKGILAPCPAKIKCRLKDENGNPAKHYSSQDEFDDEMKELYGLLHKTKPKDKAKPKENVSSSPGNVVSDTSKFDEYMSKNFHHYQPIFSSMGLKSNKKPKSYNRDEDFKNRKDDYTIFMENSTKVPKNSKFQTVTVSPIL